MEAIAIKEKQLRTIENRSQKMLRVQVLATVVALTAVFVLGETRKYQKSGLCPVSFVFSHTGSAGNLESQDFFELRPIKFVLSIVLYYFINVLYCLLKTPPRAA